ncbi:MULTISPECIES: inorganic phosphate transporter [unclassified Brevibacterium]|uniref:inorganic phosphate transporter n=1 Tax=unclassified Brevibacterium TaxID=2614124 RepID=UPI0008A4460B|nr:MULTISPECIES: inorganic phosphate transporter [unclassified Brevibacterium]OFS27014.1 phosphate transporter [Brevibacterium sp. HMSC07C04]
MDFVLLIVVLVIALALFFDFTNGFHDTANAMATPIATGALKPKTAVGLAAILNLIGALLSTEVAKTVSGGIINEEQIGGQLFPSLIFAGLIGAICWNMLTWLLGLPSSSSHALFGGLIGATIVGIGFTAVNVGGVLSKIVLPAILSPLTAAIIAFVATKVAYGVTRRYDKKPSGRDGFRWGQILTSSLVALAHGTNDAQKTMGVITLVLIAVGWQSAEDHDPQIWVVLACAFTIALGTYMGGWRIIHTLGKGLTQVRPAQGFAAESSTAATILASSALGFALSTTQVASGSVIGSGMGRRGSTVKWSMAGKIVLGWLVTLPAAGLIGAAAALFVVLLGNLGLVLDFIAATATVLGLYLYSKRGSSGPDQALSHDVADAGYAVDVERDLPPTPRQARAQERRRVEQANSDDDNGKAQL